MRYSEDDDLEEALRQSMVTYRGEQQPKRDNTTQNNSDDTSDFSHLFDDVFSDLQYVSITDTHFVHSLYIFLSACQCLFSDSYNGKAANRSLYRDIIVLFIFKFILFIEI